LTELRLFTGEFSEGNLRLYQRLGYTETHRQATPAGSALVHMHATGELNAFTVGQADRQWMHQPGSEPEVPTGSFAPISRLVEPTYDREAMLRSARHARAQGYVARVKNREHAQAVEVLLDVGPEPRRQAD
jgi:hypothetical protein